VLLVTVVSGRVTKVRDSLNLNRRLPESFSVCSVEIVSLRYGRTGPTDKFQKKTLSKVFCQKTFCAAKTLVCFGPKNSE
jgi:hypothetical protein